MMKRIESKSVLLLATIGLLGLSGCASSPDISLAYYMVKTSVEVKVTRTIMCDGGGNPIIVNAVALTPSHSADVGPGKAKQINIKNLSSGSSNSDIKFQFYADGRLKGVNASSTGQGATIIKSVLALTEALPVRGLGPSEACEFIKTHGKGKPLSLAFTAKLRDFGSTVPFKLQADPASNFYFDSLDTVMGVVCGVIEQRMQPEKPVTMNSSDNQEVTLTLRQPALISIALKVGSESQCVPEADSFWTGNAPVAQLGTEYQVPIPKAAMFGKQQFAIGLAASGAVEFIQYAKDTGVGQALAAATDVAKQFEGQSTSAQVAAVKAEADLIAQQQRLVSCLAKPEECK